MVFGNFLISIYPTFYLLYAFIFSTENLNFHEYYRVYFTDATPDNFVVNRSTLRLTFVDLDSLLIVDSHIITQTNIINRHEQIDCDHCFAFIPDELCSYQLSDINLFSVCQVCLACVPYKKLKLENYIYVFLSDISFRYSYGYN